MRGSLAIIVVGLVLLPLGCATTSGPVRPPAPPLAAQTLSGQPIALADLAGKVVVLDFFSRWCEPCIEALPHQRTLQSRYADDVVVLLVAQDEDNSELAAFLRDEHGVELPVAVDDEQKWFDAFQLRFVPSLVVIDRTGKVARRFPDVTEGTHDELEALVGSLVEEPQPGPR